MKRFSVNYAIDSMLYTRDKVELESCFKANCDFCCATCNRDCRGCRVKSTYEGLRDGFEIAEMVAARKAKAKDVVKA